MVVTAPLPLPHQLGAQPHGAAGRADRIMMLLLSSILVRTGRSSELLTGMSRQCGPGLCTSRCDLKV